LAVVGLSESQSQPGNYVLVLEEPDQQRRIPIIIGLPEAQAIALAVEQMQPMRPMTHDLMKNVMDALGAELKEVLIYRLEGGIFYAKLLIENHLGQINELEARPSDAIALSARLGAPVYAYESVILEAGIDVETLWGRPTGGSLAAYSMEELDALLQKVIEKEDYESASKIRDYIQLRSRR
jgi:uncharacterized protein